jgi:hypothetical protein
MLHSKFADLLPRWKEYVKPIQFAMNKAQVTRTRMTPLPFFCGLHLRVPASLSVPQTSLDPRSLEFETAFENRVHQALDRGREGQVQLIRNMAPQRDPAVHFQVDVHAWLRADECPIPGDKHFKLPWTGPFTILAATPSNATLDLPEHWRLLSSTSHFNKLCPFRPRLEAVGPPVPRPPPVLIQDGQSWYEVDRVVKNAWRGRSQRDGQRQLHSDADNVWRPAALLQAQGCAAHISRYHQLFNRHTPLAEPTRGEGGQDGRGACSMTRSAGVFWKQKL